MARACPVCGKPIEGRADKQFCGGTCSKRARRAAANVTHLPLRSVDGIADEPRASSDGGAVYAAALAELTEAGREGTTLGKAALALAARIDAQQDSGSALATAVRQLGETMTAATKGARGAKTELERLRERRDAKRGA